MRKIAIEMKFPKYDEFDNLSTQEKRDVSLAWARQLAPELVTCLDLNEALKHSYGIFVTYIEVAGLLNANFIKMAVQYSLFGGSLVNLGTAHHHKLIRDVQLLNVLGCFCITEKSHGSNIRGIETTAVYDKNTKEFVINTPHKLAAKTWIGMSSEANYGSVFAQLQVDGVDRGIHVFLVPFRDSRGALNKRIHLEDVGHKMGLNGLDNMSISFDNVRIPRENLLNRYSDVTESGEFISRFNTEGQQFAATVGELTGGRLSTAAHSITCSKIALVVAIRYDYYYHFT
jgi:acyl-CoA oxidase